LERKSDLHINISSDNFLKEDKAIKELVEKYGIRKWTVIAQKMQELHNLTGRSGKQCRERLVSLIYA